MGISNIPANLSASDFNFTDCKLAASWGSRSGQSQDIPYSLTTLLLYHGLDGYLARHPNISINEYESGLFIWFLNQMENNKTQILYDMMGFIGKTCQKELCLSSAYEGFSDLTGRGMIVNFFVEAGLVTTFLLILLVATKQDHLSKQLCRIRYLQRLISAVQESTRVFLDAALIFCIALLLAATKTFADWIYHPGKPFTTYAAVSSAFLSLFSIVPAFLLHVAASEELRRVKWRRFVWGFIAALAILVVALYYNLPDTIAAAVADSENDDLTRPPDPARLQRSWEIDCEEPNRQHGFKISLLVLICTTLSVFLVYALFVINIFYLPFFEPNRHPTVRKFQYGLMYAAGVLSFAGMWTALGVFVYFRHQLSKYSGSSNKDREWSFGQILAMATWLPVVVELMCIWVLGPEMGLTGQISKRYKVVENKRISGEQLEELSDSRVGSLEEGEPLTQRHLGFIKRI